MKKFLAVTLLVVPLVGCGTKTAPVTSVTPAQVAADLTGLVNTLQAIVPQVEAAAPNALTAAQKASLTSDLANAKTALAGFVAGMPATAGASRAAVIDGYLNDIIGVAATVAPPPYNTAFVAAEVIMPEVEAFVNQYLPSSVTTAPRMAAMSMTPDEARRVLHIPVVHP